MGLTLDLRIRAPEPITFGIGPGGNIAQEIHADTSNSRIWDVANSKILYFHLVNSHEFENITGFPSPKPLASPDEYASSGYAYDVISEHQNAYGEGVYAEGVFDHLVSMHDEVQSDQGRTNRDAHFATGEYMAWSEDETLPNFSLLMMPKSRLVLLEPDQTVPWFQGLDSTRS